MKLIMTGSTAAKDDLEFMMVDANDHLSPKTGLTSITVTIRKAGGSFASPSGAVSEIANGWYRVAANATDNNTLGALLLHATCSGADTTDTAYEVVSFLDTFSATIKAVGRGTVTTGAGTTSVPTSAFTPAGAIANQFAGRVLMFDADTATATLQGVAVSISASSNAAAPTFTVGTLPATPASGDKFSVI